MCVRREDSVDERGKSQDTGEVLQAWETGWWGTASQGSISLEKAPDLCLQLLVAQVLLCKGPRG